MYVSKEGWIMDECDKEKGRGGHWEWGGEVVLEHGGKVNGRSRYD